MEMRIHDCRWPATAALAASLAFSSPLVAQNVFERLAGEWQGTGTLMGRTARFTMGWEPRGVLAVLTFENAFTDTTGAVTPVLQSAAVYRTSSQNPEAVWLDSRGVRIDIRWTATDSSLVANWTAPGETGRTTYRVHSASEVEVIDEVMSGGTLRTFATARYQRAVRSR